MPSLKFYPRLKIYKYRDLVLNPETQTATSYRWYEIYKVINGIRCLNTYGYSVTTSKHVGILRNHFRTWDNDSIFQFNAPNGLQDLDSAIKHYTSKIDTLRNDMYKPRSHKAKNQERLETIIHYERIIAKIESLKAC